MVVSGLELVNLCETRKWNTQFHRKISNGKTGLPFLKFHFFRKFSSGTTRKIMFHLQPNRNFRNLLVNGKHPVSPGMRADPSYGTILLFLEQILHPDVIYPHWSTHVSWALAWMLSRCVMKWWELRDSLAYFSQRWQGIRQRRKTRDLLSTFILWFNGKGVFFRVENFFNFVLWMNKIRSPASVCSCREKFCKKTVYSGIELICEFAKIWLIINKTYFDSFLLFLLVWQFSSLGYFAKVFERQTDAYE